MYFIKNNGRGTMTAAILNKDFVEQIEKAKENNSLIFFIGAGVTASQGYSSWNDYVRHLIEYWKYNFDKLKSEYPYKTDWISQLDWLEKSTFSNERKVDIVRYLVKKYAKQSVFEDEVLSFERQYFNELVPVSSQNLILNQLARIPAIYITTNYDSQIEKSLKQQLEVEPFAIHSTESFGKYLVNNEINSPTSTVIHLHGDTFVKSSNFISSSKSYSDLYYKDSDENLLFFKKIKDFLIGKTIVFLGYGLEEDQVLAKLNLSRKNVSAYALMKRGQKFDNLIEDYYKERQFIQIEWYGTSFDDLPKYVEKLADRINGFEKDSNLIQLKNMLQAEAYEDE